MLASRTGRPCHLMSRGIASGLFTPARRRRSETGAPFVIGYAGRLSAEKNVRMLGHIDEVLRRLGQSGYRLKIVGEGSERAWLQANLPDAELCGLLKGELLADAYADMDVFVFPSETDTFGNVVLEALASGVPTVVSDHGGPKYLVNDGVTGRTASDASSFAQAVIDLRSDQERRRRMAAAARESVLGRDWGAVFDGVYARYQEVLGGVSVTGRRQTAIVCPT
jgi:phosphatidylinositol alpha 1,6-mannosyltransferase